MAAPLLSTAFQIAAVLLGTLAFGAPAAAGSTCFGTPSHGRLQDGAQLPSSGKNFVVYSTLGASLGRNWVHASVAQTMLTAYRQLEGSAPGIRYVYGETGLAAGGPMKPHRTHEAGISVDFMVPVRDAAGRSVPLPASALNKFGYGWEFDAVGKAEELTIDFEAIGEHLYQLALAGKQLHAPIGRVIFDPRYLDQLFKTRHGAFLRTLPLMQQKPWIRHDEHYHVDFTMPCKPFA